MHYLIDTRFSDAVDHFLQQEGNLMHQYLNELEERKPIKKN
jgi:predicted N-acyltransferase